MKKAHVTLLIGIIFIVGGLSFSIKQDWIFAAMFFILGVVFLLRLFKGSNDGNSKS